METQEGMTMANENNFKDTVNSLFKGMDSFISAKTVVGEAIHVGDTIILPLMDVSFGLCAGAFSGAGKENGRKGRNTAGNYYLCSGFRRAARSRASHRELRFFFIINPTNSR